MVVNSTVSGSGSSSSDLSLLRRVQALEPQAWRQFTDLYGPLVFHWGLRYGLCREDAADVVQETFVAVTRSVRGFQSRGKGSFRGWLWTVARNKIRDSQRRQIDSAPARGGSTARRLIEQVPEAPSDVESDDRERAAWHQLLHRGLKFVQNEFEDYTWQRFWRVVVDGRSPAEVAEELSTTPAAVRQAKSRVLRRLREVLGDLLE